MSCQDHQCPHRIPPEPEQVVRQNQNPMVPWCFSSFSPTKTCHFFGNIIMVYPIFSQPNIIAIWLVVSTPLKIWVRQLGWLFPTEWTNKIHDIHVPVTTKQLFVYSIPMIFQYLLDMKHISHVSEPRAPRDRQAASSPGERQWRYKRLETEESLHHLKTSDAESAIAGHPWCPLVMTNMAGKLPQKEWIFP